jgi:hypothetical protein
MHACFWHPSQCTHDTSSRYSVLIIQCLSGGPSVPERSLVVAASLLPRHCAWGCVAALFSLQDHPFLGLPSGLLSALSALWAHALP